MKKYLIFLILMWMLLNSIGKLAEVPTSHLEPLPSLESAPNYGGNSMEFVYY
jgi:hypothetical protein